MNGIREAKILGFRAGLLEWFYEYGRIFPWRQTRDPYKIMLAEKLLQQTSVRQDLIEIYNNLLAKYPTIDALANADVEKVRAEMQPLGLHYRSQEIINLAQEICKKHDGEIPSDFKSLMALSGIGDYTARAILCFSFAQAVPVVDTNVARVLYRVFNLTGKFPANPARKRSLIVLAEDLIRESSARELNLAMIDLGALVCRPKNPLCRKCPLREVCAYYQLGGEFHEA